MRNTWKKCGMVREARQRPSLVVPSLLPFDDPGGRLSPVLMPPTPQLSFKTWGGGGGGGGSWGGGSSRGSGGGVPGRRSGGRPARGEGGGGVRLGLRSPSWWNQSWFYNPF